MKKQIHVNSYVKRDGTQVREHFRNVDTDNYKTPPIVQESDIPPINYPSEKSVVMYETPVLKGGVSVEVMPTTSVDDILGSIGRIAVNVLPLALQILQASNSGNAETANYLLPKFNNQMTQFDVQVSQMKNNIDNGVSKLVTVKNQADYSNLYKMLQKDYQVYQKAVTLSNSVKANINAGNYHAVANELENYTANWDKDGRVFYTDNDNKPIVMKNNNRFKNQLKAFSTNTKNWINETNPNSEAYRQKMYLTSLAASAPLRLGAGVTTKIGQSLTPLLGQKIAQLTAQGISGGLASGVTSGFARGLIYDKNPFLTSAQDALVFASMGGLSNFGLANIQRAIAQYQIYNSPVKEILINDYIKNYVEGLENFRKEIDNIRAMKAGTKPFGGTKQVMYNTESLKYTGKYVKIDGKTYKEIWLSQDEYALVEHAFSNFAKQGKLKNVIIDITMPHETDYVYYSYKAVIDRNGTPMIIYKEVNYD